ncbi:hypothetical protein [Moritella sp. F3]|uniref:hypothetical protein n=1 Tax=Moritella sp. F3 TaxID=2718882 RepID=UPI0018E0C8AA|nr:hypothetical protein [Moritella sp. F3]GIC77110.1 hypothetical protein FMO001_18370 [Moritella sp. F1]GIC82229.1 hypothetical protein FMO003_25100 [Moritella sp. F3]
MNIRVKLALEQAGVWSKDSALEGTLEDGEPTKDKVSLLNMAVMDMIVQHDNSYPLNIAGVSDDVRETYTKIMCILDKDKKEIPHQKNLRCMDL